jgi:hypothetical protein
VHPHPYEKCVVSYMHHRLACSLQTLGVILHILLNSALYFRLVAAASSFGLSSSHDELAYTWTGVFSL